MTSSANTGTVSAFERWEQAYQKEDGHRWWPENELVRFIGRTYGTVEATKLSRGRALDLGCGTGRHCWLLHEAGFEAFGIDASMSAVERANDYALKRGANIARIGCRDVTDLSCYRDDCFALVIDCQTIQHLSLDDHRRVYRQISRVLASGGRFWTMHWREGDADQLYAGHYPELRAWPINELGPLIEANGLELQGDPYLITRGNLEQRVMASWYAMGFVKP